MISKTATLLSVGTLVLLLLSGILQNNANAVTSSSPSGIGSANSQLGNPSLQNSFHGTSPALSGMLSHLHSANGSPPSAVTKIAPSNSSQTPPPPPSNYSPLPSTKPLAHNGKPEGTPRGTPTMDSKGHVVQPCASSSCYHQWDIVYFSQSGDDYGGTFVAQANNIGGWGCSAALCTGDANDALILPMNIDLGNPSGSQVWFQFDIDFGQNCGLGICGNAINSWAIWNNPSTACGSDITYNQNGIGISYTPGHSYEWHFYPTGNTGTQMVFLIKDDSSGNFWWKQFTVPSENLIYNGSCFSPAAAVETYIDGAGLSSVPLTGVPFYQFFEGNLPTDIISGTSTNIFGSGSYYYISCDFCNSSTGTNDGYQLGIYQSMLENGGGGTWWWNLFPSGSEVPVSISLLTDATSNPISVSNDYPFYYTQNGCGYCYVVNYKADSTQSYQYSPGSLTVAASPNTYLDLSTYSTSSGGGDYWCYSLSAGLCQDNSVYSYGGASYAFYYYEVLEAQPYMNVINGGSPPSVSLSYRSAPTSPGSSDAPLSTSATLTTSSQVIWPLRASIASVPTCDPQGLHFNGVLFVPYCGTNLGGYPTERWDAFPDGPQSCGFLFLCSTQFTITGVNSLTAINYWHQDLTPIAFHASDGSTGYSSNPHLNVMQFGAPNSISLTTSPSYNWIDANSVWGSSPVNLAGSNSTQRWHAAINTGAISGAAVNVDYLHQCLVTFKVSPTGTGTTNPSGFWTANVKIPIVANPAAGWTFKAWSPSTTKIQIGNVNLATTTMNVTGPGTITDTNIPNVVLGVSPNSLTISHGSTGATTSTIKGAPQLVKLTFTSTNAGVKLTVATNPITDSIAGVTDAVTVHVAPTVAPGSYTVTLKATGADGVVSTAVIHVKVT